MNAAERTRLGVGPVLHATPFAAVVVAAIQAENEDVVVEDEGAYLRVQAPRVCRLSSSALAAAGGHDGDLPDDLGGRLAPISGGRRTGPTVSSRAARRTCWTVSSGRSTKPATTTTWPTVGSRSSTAGTPRCAFPPTACRCSRPTSRRWLLRRGLRTARLSKPAPPFPATTEFPPPPSTSPHISLASTSAR